jgi:hypothetical protein
MVLDGRCRSPHSTEAAFSRQSASSRPTSDLEVLGVVREQGEAALALLAAADGSANISG